MTFHGLLRVGATSSFTALSLAVASCRDSATAPPTAVEPSPSRSTVSVSAATVASGSVVTVTLRLFDDAGRPVNQGGRTVEFVPQGGLSTGSVGPTSDLGDGSYQAPFTGIIAGSPTGMGARVDGVAITSPLPTIRVTPGPFLPATSTVTISPRTVLPGGKAKLELITRDAAGNALDKGGLKVTLILAGGASAGVVGPVTDHNNGRYSAEFSALQPGPAIEVIAEVEGTPLTTPSVTMAVARGISIEDSRLTIAYDTVTIGNGLRVSLQLRDSANVARISGGDTVQFVMLQGATGTGVLDDFVDHDDGTYSANFTATKEGSVTFAAIINGREKKNDLATLAIEPTQVAPQKSSVYVSADTVAAGDSAIFTAELRDLHGVPVSSSNHTVNFSLSADGTSAGVIEPAQYEGDGVWSAKFTGIHAGTRVWVSATVDDSAEIQMLDDIGNSHLPSMIVIPGSVSVDSSRLTTHPSFISVGDTALIVLAARDAFGNDLTSGGLNVEVSRSGGAGVSVGRLTAVLDHDNGRYTSRYVADSSGSPDVIRATINGVSLASLLPEITVGTSCLAGPLSFSRSDLTINDTTRARVPVKSLTLPSGITTTLTVRLNDANSCPVVVPHSVAVTAAGGSTGEMGETVQLGDGRYEISFKGRVASGETILSAIVDGLPLASLPVRVSVVPGDISTHTSHLSADNATIAAGAQTVLRLQAKDVAGNRIHAGGRTVEFAVDGDIAHGTIAATVDNQDGSYSATYIAGASGGTDAIVAYIDGTPVTLKLMVTVLP